MKKAIIAQILIFITAWALMTPDQLVDNTYVFGLIGNVEVIRGNSIWVLSGAAILSAINIWLWWPKEVKVASISETSAKGIKSTKAEEAKAEETKDPIVPKMD